jgi:hypothetical protein
MKKPLNKKYTLNIVRTLEGLMKKTVLVLFLTLAGLILLVNNVYAGEWDYYMGEKMVVFLGNAKVTVKSHPVREGCSKGVGQSNHHGKGHTEYGQRAF